VQRMLIGKLNAYLTTNGSIRQQTATLPEAIRFQLIIALFGPAQLTPYSNA
jgi:hypothetical protein